MNKCNYLGAKALEIQYEAKCNVPRRYVRGSDGKLKADKRFRVPEPHDVRGLELVVEAYRRQH